MKTSIEKDPIIMVLETILKLLGGGFVIIYCLLLIVFFSSPILAFFGIIPLIQMAKLMTISLGGMLVSGMAIVISGVDNGMV